MPQYAKLPGLCAAGYAVSPMELIPATVPVRVAPLYAGYSMPGAASRA